MKTILVTCCNEGCNNQFRISEYPFNSKIKNNPEKQECLVCKNKKLLAQSTLYRNNKQSLSQTKYTTKTKSGKKRLKTPKNNIDKELNDAWSKIVKLRAGNKCEVCGKTKTLNSHHIYSRAKKSVTWYLPNGICLCVGHHIGNVFSAHKTPTEFTEWLINYKGKKFMEDLKIKANTITKYHQFEKELLLKELREEIKKYK